MQIGMRSYGILPLHHVLEKSIEHMPEKNWKKSLKFPRTKESIKARESILLSETLNQFCPKAIAAFHQRGYAFYEAECVFRCVWQYEQFFQNIRSSYLPEGTASKPPLAHLLLRLDDADLFIHLYQLWDLKGKKLQSPHQIEQDLKLARERLHRLMQKKNDLYGDAAFLEQAFLQWFYPRKHVDIHKIPKLQEKLEKKMKAVKREVELLEKIVPYTTAFMQQYKAPSKQRPPRDLRVYPS